MDPGEVGGVVIQAAAEVMVGAVRPLGSASASGLPLAEPGGVTRYIPVEIVARHFALNDCCRNLQFSCSS